MYQAIFAGIASACVFILAPAGNCASTMLSSWYGPGFNGRLTANGEIYNMHDYTAAHKTLPFGTKLRVCYEKCVDVRINDRGPFIGARELDLSFASAKAIGLVEPGVAHVSVTHL